MNSDILIPFYILSDINQNKKLKLQIIRRFSQRNDKNSASKLLAWLQVLLKGPSSV